MRPLVQAFFDPVTFTASYVLQDPASTACAIIDPVLDFDAASGRTRTDSADRIIAHISANDLRVLWLIETHVHADHLTAAPYLQSKLGGKIVIGAHVSIVQKAFRTIFNIGADFAVDGSQFDRLLEEGETLDIGGLKLMAMHTPGHTPACMTYLAGDAAFIGDTLFMPDYGTARADFPGGDARDLYRSIRKILALPDTTRLFLCHDYQTPERKQFVWETTVAAQKSGNVHVHDGISEEDFVKMRTARDATLNMPALILPSVQINMRAGHFPEPESNGVSYLKLPVNYF
ncbi:MAG TPA: MBL fold metallo-hydrolase [Alphaproteobacteria bacterium]|nr:MBL fold metallo-hydrolase [Alphaproteobacteria bacterium]